MFILASTCNKNKVSLDQNIHQLLKHRKTMFIKEKLLECISRISV
jgi:hypothetical protein